LLRRRRGSLSNLLFDCKGTAFIGKNSEHFLPKCLQPTYKIFQNAKKRAKTLVFPPIQPISDPFLLSSSRLFNFHDKWAREKADGLNFKILGRKQASFEAFS
jgi:hypothetical protein